MHKPQQRKLVDYAKRKGGPRLRSAPAARRLGANPKSSGRGEADKTIPAALSGGRKAGEDELLNEQRIPEKRGHLDCSAGPPDWVASAAPSIAQWCLPSRRQQLGRSGDGSATRAGEMSEKLNSATSSVARTRRYARSANAHERRSAFVSHRRLSAFIGG
jgi:hypothetical protein